MHLTPDLPHTRLLLLLIWITAFVQCALAIGDYSGLDSQDTHAQIRQNADQPAGTQHEPRREEGGQAYEASFQGVPRDIIGRAGVFLNGLQRDTPQNLNILPGSTVYYSFEAKPTSKPDRRRSLQDVVEAPVGLDTGSDIVQDPVTFQPINAAEDGEPESELAVRQTRADDDATNVYISINTCIQPSYRDRREQRSPPQLSLLTLPIRSGQQFEDENPTGFQTTPLVEGYAGVNLRISEAVVIAVAAPKVARSGSTDWNFDIAASVNGPYHNFLATPPTSLKMVDSDPHAALLITDGLEEWSKNQANKTFGLLADNGPPLDIFANNINFTGLVGLDHSYCAQHRAAQIQGSTGSNTFPGFERGLTVAQPSKLTEERFYLPGLNTTSTYYGRLATLNGTTYGKAATVGGGGTLYPAMNFTTKHDENCAVVYNLTFCSDVNYAVPANPNLFDRAALTSLYDDNAARLYQNFSYSLQQIPCNTTATAQYSLAVTCDDCAAAYKTWLCAVTIPKCMDFSTNFGVNTIPDAFLTSTDSRATSFKQKFGLRAGDDNFDVDTDDGAAAEDQADPMGAAPAKRKTNPYLMPRNLAQSPLLASTSTSTSTSSTSSNPPNTPNHPIDPSLLRTLATNSSRVPSLISSQIRPGPYLEVLPCADLCYDLVRMCPAALGFQCPAPGSRLEGVSYGYRGVGAGGAYTCNAPGAVYYPNAANGRFAMTSWWSWVVLVSISLGVAMSL